MKYYDTFSESGYHSAFLTTFTFSAQSFEDMILQRLRNAGCNNIHVIADQNMLNQELSLFGAPRQAGTSYHLMKCLRRGAFHPKMVLQLGNKKARLLVGSANLTGPGLAGNLELISEISCSGLNDPSVALIAEAVNYFESSLSEADPWFRRGFSQALARTPWLDRATASSSYIDPKHGLTAIVHEANPISPLDQFVDLIEDDSIRRVNIVSPYWDKSLEAVKALKEKLNNPSIRIAIEPSRGLFPSQSAKQIDNLTIHELTNFSGSRSVHAKLLIAEGTNFDHVLSGSLNCSRAAMLSHSGWPYNSELGVYRRVAKQTAVKSMGLKPSFATTIAPEKLPSFVPPADDDQVGLRYVDGGNLFLTGGRLVWRSSDSLNCDVLGVILSGPGLPDQIVNLNHTNEEWLARIPEGYHSATTGRIVFEDTTESSPIVICNMNVLPVRSHPIGDRKVQNQLSALASFRTEDLEIIDILYRLEHIQRDENAAIEPPRTGARLTIKAEPMGVFNEFTYDAFLANRIDNSQSATASGDAIFADQYVSDVSRLLNRILGIVAPLKNTSEDEDVEDLRPTEHAFEDDVLSDDFANHPEDNPILEKVTSRQSQRHTEKMLLTAVGRYTEARSQITKDQVSITELIHLRALLQIILAFATPMTGPLRPDQVLPSFDKSKITGWPRLIGRILVAFFSEYQNPIANLRIPKSAETIPTEVVDSWACIDVASTLSEGCAIQFDETAFIARHLGELSKRATACIGQSINHFPDAKERFEMTKSQLNLRFKNLI